MKKSILIFIALLMLSFFVGIKNLQAQYCDFDGDGYGVLGSIGNNEVSFYPQCTAYGTGGAIEASVGGDCDESNPNINPGVEENWCDGVDTDCDFGTEAILGILYDRDVDGDGFGGNTNDTLHICYEGEVVPGYVPRGYFDCNDFNSTVYPGAPEICDGIDNDCDVAVDEGLPQQYYFQDADNDGYGNPSAYLLSCGQPIGYVLDYTDCNDDNSDIHPDATETCNLMDDNCNSQTDEGFEVYQDSDGDGYGNINIQSVSCLQPTGYVSNFDDCDDTNSNIHPGVNELCNALDDDCDGYSDEDFDMDGDGICNTIDNCPLTSNFNQADFDNNGIGDACDCDDSDADGICNSQENCQWQMVGNPWHILTTQGGNFSYSPHTNFALSPGGTPYVTFTDYGNQYRVNVKKLVNSTWEDVGAPGFIQGNFFYHPGISLAVSPDEVPYIALSDENNESKVSVMKFNGTSWEYVGTPGFSTDAASDIQIKFDAAGAVYACYTIAFLDEIVVRKFNGTSWVNVGTPGFATGYYVNMAIGPDNNPVVVFRDRVDIDNLDKATVMKYNGSGWVTMGSRGFSDGIVEWTNIAVDALGTPYVTYKDFAHGEKATVMKYNGSNWVNVGSPGFSSFPVSYTDIAIDASGVPYASHSDGGLSAVKKFNGSAWENICTPRFGYGPTQYSNFALDISGTPYVMTNMRHFTLYDQGKGYPTLWTPLPCFSPVITSLSASADTVCSGDFVQLSIDDGSSLNSAGNWSWFEGSCGGSNISISPFAYVYPTATTTYYVRGEGNCVVADACESITIYVGTPSFWYQDIDGDGFGDKTAYYETCSQPEGFVPDSTDCDDYNAAVHIGCPLITYYADYDGDAYGDTTNTLVTGNSVAPYPYIADNRGDCEDYNYSINPGAPEICNGYDDDCDGLVDIDDPGLVIPTWYADTDGDSYGDASTISHDCPMPSGYVSDSSDCDDTQMLYSDADLDGFGHQYFYAPCGVSDNTDCYDYYAAVYPGAPEICDGWDNDCDGLYDANDPNYAGDPVWYQDADGDGFGNSEVSLIACPQPGGYVSDSNDCDDAQLFYGDLDGDGFPGTLVACDGATESTDCYDYYEVVYPGAPEICDGWDNDCDGIYDTEDPDYVGDATWYLDADGDGYGNISSDSVDCPQPYGYVNNSDDCDDTNIDIYQGADCNDGNACTLDDVCDNSVCAGIPLNCNDTDDCTVDDCNPSSGCEYEHLFPTTLTCPADIIVTADAGTCSASPIFSASPIYLNCNVLSLTNSASPLFTAGTTPVIWTLTDINNNTLTCTQQITVIADCDDEDVCTTDACSGASCTNTAINCDDDDACTVDACDVALGCQNTSLYPETITCPAHVIAIADAGACSASNVLLGQPSLNINCNVTSIANNALAIYPVGTTGIVWKAYLTNGDSLSCAQMATILDNQNPTISCPASVTVNANAGQCIATGVSLGTAIASDNCAVSTDNNAPASFPVGNTNVTWTATDASGNIATCVQTVTVNANTEICNGVDDDCDGQVDENISCDDSNECSTDVCAGVSGCQNTPIFPTTITCPANVIESANVDACSASSISLGTPTVNPNCNVASISNNASSIYPVGTTGIAWKVYFTNGDSLACVQTVTIIDNQNPTINCPANVVVVTNVGQCTATAVSLGTATASDNCAVSTDNNTPATFPIGNTSVTWTATDASGNTATCVQTVTVNANTEICNGLDDDCDGQTDEDVTCDDSDECTVDVCAGINGCQNTPIFPTTITCPANVIESADAGACSNANVTLGQPSLNTTCNVTSITNTAPSIFNVGTTGIAWKAYLTNGDSLSCAQIITILDTQNPTITCPANVIVNANAGQCVATGVSLGTATASDNCAVSTNNNAPASFTIGNTSVTWTATDASGNTATCVQTVTVNANTEICNGIDDDCDGQVDEVCGVDIDGDGYSASFDCNDNNPAINPGASESCNGIDDNCNAQIDEGFLSTAPISITTNDADNKICSGAPITLTVSGGTLGIGASYKWYSGSCGGTFVGTGNQITVSPTVSTTYFVRIEGCNTTTCVLKSITLWPNPSSSITPTGTTTVCQGASALLTANGVGLTYQWYLGATPLGATGSTYTVNSSLLPVNTNSQFRVLATNSNGCSAYSAFKNVMVRPLPNANFTPTGNITLCAGATQLLSAPAGGTTYQWSRNGSPIGGNTNSLSAYQSGTYSLKVTSSYSCTATSSASAVITHSTANLTANAGPDQNTLCVNNAAFAGNTPGVGVTGTWTLVSGSGTPADANSPTSTATGLSAGLNKFIWQLSDGICTGAVDTVVLNVLQGSANPVYITAGSSPNFCFPGSVTLTAHVCGTGWTFRWQRNGVNISPAQTAQSYTVTSSAIATYRVRATKSGIDYFSNTISINTVPVVTINGPSAICPPNVTSTVSVPEFAGVTYAWYKNNVAIGGAANAFYVVTSAGAYRCRLYYTPTCYQMTNSVTITALPNCSSKMEEGTTTTVEQLDAFEISIYPNPATERFFIEVSGIKDETVLQLSIYDLAGKELFRQDRMYFINGQPLPVEVPNNISTGLYLVVLRNDEDKFVKRIVIGR